MKRISYWIIAAITFTVNIALDRITKLLAIAFLKGQASLSFLGQTVVLTYAENSGAFLGMGADWPLWIKYSLLVIIPIVVCLIAFAYGLFKETDKYRLVLIVSVVAGGLGNLVDRLINDFRVVDFMNFGIGPLRTGILNVADISVTFGAILLVIHELRQNKADAAKVPEAEHPTE